MFIISIALISSVIFISATIVGYSDARKMGTYSCTNIPNSGTIGKTKCCAIDLDTAKDWCTICDNTNPPSNCGPAEPQHTKGGDNVNPKDNGGVLSQNDDLSGSKGIDNSKIQEGGTFSDSNSGSSKGIDSNKINSGIKFNQ